MEHLCRTCGESYSKMPGEFCLDSYHLKLYAELKEIERQNIEKQKEKKNSAKNVYVVPSGRRIDPEYLLIAEMLCNISNELSAIRKIMEKECEESKLEVVRGQK
jgi:hypothetical protein